MIRKLVSTLAAILCVGSSAYADQPLVTENTSVCTSDYNEVAPFLYENFGEERQVAGVSTVYGTIIEIYANEMTGSWTIIEIEPNGTACMVDSGMMFMVHRPNV